MFILPRGLGIFLLKAGGLLAILSAIILYTIQPYVAIFKWVSSPATDVQADALCSSEYYDFYNTHTGHTLHHLNATL